MVSMDAVYAIPDLYRGTIRRYNTKYAVLDTFHTSHAKLLHETAKNAFVLRLNITGQVLDIQSRSRATVMAYQGILSVQL